MYTSLITANRDKSPLKQSLILDSKLSVYDIDSRTAISRSAAKKLLKSPQSYTYIADLNIIGMHASVEKTVETLRKSGRKHATNVDTPRTTRKHTVDSDSNIPVIIKSHGPKSNNRKYEEHSESDVSSDSEIVSRNKQVVKKPSTKTTSISNNANIIKFVETHGPACVEHLRKNSDLSQLFNMSTGNTVSTIQPKTHIRSKIYTRVMIRKDTHLHKECNLDSSHNDEIIAAIEEYIRTSDYGKTIATDGKGEHKISNSKSTSSVIAASRDGAAKNNTAIKDTEAIAVSENIPRRERPRIADVDTIQYVKTPKADISRKIANKSHSDSETTSSEDTNESHNDSSSSSSESEKRGARGRTAKKNKPVDSSSESDTTSNCSDIQTSDRDSDSDGAASVGSTDNDKDVGFDSQADDSIELSDD